MKHKKLITNVIVSHQNNAIGTSCKYCEFRPVIVRQSIPFSFQSSDALAETRAFLSNPPESIETKFVSFVSGRIAEKSNGNIDYHSACCLVPKLSKNQVISPFTIKNTPERLIKPSNDAPPYAYHAALVYQTIFTLRPDLEESFLNNHKTKEHLYPFCNSFVMSARNYRKFYNELMPLVNEAWEKFQFYESWCEHFSAQFPNREFGMLFERFTALYIGHEKRLKVLSNGWAEKYPPSNGQWQSTSNQIQLAGMPLSEYN